MNSTGLNILETLIKSTGCDVYIALFLTIPQVVLLTLMPWLWPSNVLPLGCWDALGFSIWSKGWLNTRTQQFCVVWVPWLKCSKAQNHLLRYESSVAVKPSYPCRDHWKHVWWSFLKDWLWALCKSWRRQTTSLSYVLNSLLKLWPRSFKGFAIRLLQKAVIWSRFDKILQTCCIGSFLAFSWDSPGTLNASVKTACEKSMA